MMSGLGFFVLFLICFSKSTPILSLDAEENQNETVASDMHSPSIVESTNELLGTRTSWRKTFNEIKSIVVPETKKHEMNSNSQDGFGRWKAFLDEKYGFDVVPPSQRVGISDQGSDRKKRLTHTCDNHDDSEKRKRQRYDGFLSWEKLLQQWADDVTNYISEPHVDETISAENEGKSKQDDAKKVLRDRSITTVDGEYRDRSNIFEYQKQSDRVRKDVDLDRSSLVSLGASFLPFWPRPQKAGEPVVAKTDLSDKSKNIWIVTTAALPWMTGTAVNPLLRAAYMCVGRTVAGGSVTILLPWLERHADQTRVYGEKNGFESREDQEEYVRSWLRDTADMKEASSELRIRWYTAWQERAENSIYSMGDITSLIPEHEADICVSISLSDRF